MSMMSCEECGHLIDTDFSPESFRELFDDQCLCDVCYDEMLEHMEDWPDKIYVDKTDILKAGGSGDLGWARDSKTYKRMSDGERIPLYITYVRVDAISKMLEDLEDGIRRRDGGEESQRAV